jgi:4-cresol dehydrogenase (hydroxylating)
MASHRSPTVNPQALGNFFDDVARVLGEDNISRTPSHGALEGAQGRKSYGDPFSTAGTHEPSGAVRPSTVEEVQEVMKLANKHKLSLWTVSRGKNLGFVADDVSRPYGSCISLTVTDMVDPALSSKDALS